jgi:hypothetical protein
MVTADFFSFLCNPLQMRHLQGLARFLNRESKRPYVSPSAKFTRRDNMHKKSICQAIFSREGKGRAAETLGRTGWQEPCQVGEGAAIFELFFS